MALNLDLVQTVQYKHSAHRPTQVLNGNSEVNITQPVCFFSLYFYCQGYTLQLVTLMYLRAYAQTHGDYSPHSPATAYSTKAL